jgi:copper(I)-binding protein
LIRKYPLLGPSSLIPAILLTAGLSLTEAAALPADGVSVRDAWVREPSPSRDVTAAFAVIENAGREARAIVSASAAQAEKVELHEMKKDGEMMRMSPVERIEVPAGGRTELKPGGLHLMLFGLKKRLAAGEVIALEIALDDGTVLSVPATVRSREGAQ